MNIDASKEENHVISASGISIYVINVDDINCVT